MWRRSGRPCRRPPRRRGSGGGGGLGPAFGRLGAGFPFGGGVQAKGLGRLGGGAELVAVECTASHGDLVPHVRSGELMRPKCGEGCRSIINQSECPATGLAARTAKLRNRRPPIRQRLHSPRQIFDFTKSLPSENLFQPSRRIDGGRMRRIPPGRSPLNVLGDSPPRPPEATPARWRGPNCRKTPDRKGIPGGASRHGVVSGPWKE